MKPNNTQIYLALGVVLLLALSIFVAQGLYKKITTDQIALGPQSKDAIPLSEATKSKKNSNDEKMMQESSVTIDRISKLNMEVSQEENDEKKLLDLTESVESNYVISGMYKTKSAASKKVKMLIDLGVSSAKVVKLPESKYYSACALLTDNRSVAQDFVYQIERNYEINSYVYSRKN